MQSEMFRKVYGEVFKGDERWNSLPVPEGDLYQWDPQVDLRQASALFRGHDHAARRRCRHQGGPGAALLGDSITTDHISPAGSIKADSPAGKYLIEHGVAAEGLQLLRLAARQPRGDGARHLRQRRASRTSWRPAPRAASPGTCPTASRCRSSTPR